MSSSCSLLKGSDGDVLTSSAASCGTASARAAAVVGACTLFSNNVVSVAGAAGDDGVACVSLVGGGAACTALR